MRAGTRRQTVAFGIRLTDDMRHETVASRMKTKPTRLAMLGIMLLCAAGSAFGYEEDVHYGLTRWLALKAGFTTDEAEMIAQANVEVDHSFLSATSLVAHYACLERDRMASETVRDFHFPSAAVVPSYPEDRKVEAGGHEALRKTEERITRPGNSLPDNLRQLGKGLHPLQDSWSHQGVPGSPVQFLCDVQLSWGHPEARGGWRSHEADQTFRHPSEEVLAMATASYKQLCRFREKVLKKKCEQDLVPEQELSGFATADTQQGKSVWFSKQGITPTQFLNSTSLPGGNGDGTPNPPIYDDKVGSKLVPLSNVNTLKKTAAESFMLGFFKAWMTQTNMAEVVKAWMAPAQFTSDFTSPRGRVIVSPTALQAQLMFWRVRDHGAATLIGKSDHDVLQASGIELATFLRWPATGVVRYTSIDQALLPLDPEGTPLWASEWKSPDGRILYLGGARLRHAPLDSVFVAAAKVAGNYRVIYLDSVIEH